MRSKPGRRLLLVPLLMMSIALVAAACGDDETAEDTADAVIDEALDSTTSTTDDSEPVTDGTDGTDAADAADAGPEDADDSDGGQLEELFPDVVGATAERAGDGSWTFSATLSSPYDTPDRYADAWRVVGPDGEVYGIRELTHDHANEQPFTRSQSGIVVPDGVTAVTVEGRDQVSGWGGATVEVELAG